MNWMFFPKAVGVVLIALTSVLVPTDTPRKPATVQFAQVKKPHHEPAPVPEPAPAPAPAPEVISEPVHLEPLARAVISTWNGEEVPKVWPAGVPLDLTSKGSNAGDLPQSIRWEIVPEWVDKYSRRAGRTVSIATGTKSKTIRVTLYVAKNDTFDMASVTVAIRPDPAEPGDRVRPEPTPTPPEPTPTPPTPTPVPPALSSLGKQVYDLALRDIPDISARKDKVLGLAASHESIAADVSQAVAGVPAYAALKEPKAIVDATVKSNNAVVGTDRQAYVPFFTSLNGVLKPLTKTTLSTAGGHIEVWKDIAAGLRASVP